MVVYNVKVETIRRQLRANLDAVEARIIAACTRAGRSRADVTLVAVTKSVSTEVASLLPELGVFDLGESRPQELWRKAEWLPTTVRWHMIGHLQRNKLEQTVPIAHIIHSVDSLRLLRAIEGEAGRQGREIPVLLEMNVSEEESKQGFPNADLPELARFVCDLKHVRLRGLMTMAALQDAELCRPTFASLRQMRDSLNDQLRPAQPLEYLSMGMSNDFEVAIEEGATHIRVGTLLFEGIV